MTRAEGRAEAQTVAPAGVQETRIDTGVGYKVETLEGDRYEARFVGTAWNTADQDEGAFLSNVPYDEHSQTEGYLEREQFGIDQLFPSEWRETEIEYEIVVRARRVQGKKPLLGESAFERFRREVEAEADADPTGEARKQLDSFRDYYAEERKKKVAAVEEVWGFKPGTGDTAFGLMSEMAGMEEEDQ